LDYQPLKKNLRNQLKSLTSFFLLSKMHVALVFS